MKKTILLSILTTPLLFAYEDFSLIKQKGMEYFKNNNYQLAIEEFIKIDDYKQSSSIDFYLARSYYELGMFEKALIVYERILINEPNNKRVQLEIAQTYLMLDSFQIAKISFLEILNDSSVPQIVKDNIENRLKFIDEKTKKHFFTSTLMFGWGYDDNINNTTSINSFNINVSNLGLINIPSDDKVKSSFYETAALFNHMYRYNENLSIKNGLVFYKQDFTMDETKQLAVISLNTTPIYQMEDFSYGLTFGIDNILYGNNRYSNNYSLTPKFSYLIDPLKIYETGIKFLAKRFIQEKDDGNDAWVYEYQNRLIFQTQNYGIFDISLVLGKEIDEKNIRYDVSKEYESLTFGNSYKIDEQFTVNSTVSYSNVDYHDENRLFGTKRVDDIFNLILGLNYNYSKDLTFGLNYTHVEQNSNQTPTDYNKNIIKTSMYYSF